MWNPFKKKPDTFLESIKHHIVHEQKPMHTMRNIALGVILLFLLGGILFPMFRKLSQAPVFREPTNIVSSEITPSKDKEDINVKPGEICMKHPDIFVLNYTLSGVVNTGSIDKQMQAIQELGQKGAISLIDESNFQKSLERGCFTGNPLWIVSSAKSDTTDILTPITQTHFIPLFANTTDWSSFTGYTIEQIDITNLTSTKSLEEILRKYLEVQSGGIFKNL